MVGVVWNALRISVQFMLLLFRYASFDVLYVYD